MPVSPCERLLKWLVKLNSPFTAKLSETRGVGPFIFSSNEARPHLVCKDETVSIVFSLSAGIDTLSPSLVPGNEII